jgi:hypothetical protein
MPVSLTGLQLTLPKPLLAALTRHYAGANAVEEAACKKSLKLIMGRPTSVFHPQSQAVTHHIGAADAVWLAS